MADDQIVAAVVAIAPAEVSITSGVNDYGLVEQRDSRLYDKRLNVMVFNTKGSGNSIAVIVRWNSRPEAKLG